MQGYDYLCETRLKELNPDLHRRFLDIGFVAVRLLEKYKNYFPDFTDHTVNHALHVIEFCNRLIGPENVRKMNDEELYSLLAGCYLHDIGMGISEELYEKTESFVVSKSYREAHPDADRKELIRAFHQEFSSYMIHRYSELLEIPSAEQILAVSQVARGHRKTNLYDNEEYSSGLEMPSGKKVCLPYLAALIRLSDEMDIAADRNLAIEYELVDTIHRRAHAAVKGFEILDDCFLVRACTDEEDVREEIISVVEKLQQTLDECVDVVEKRTPYSISQKKVKLKFCRD